MHKFRFTKIALNTNLKVLRKDFIDEWQIYESKYIGAIVFCLLLNTYRKFKSAFIKLSKSLDIDVLLEFHEEQELSKVLKSELDLIELTTVTLRLFKRTICMLSSYIKHKNDFQRFSIIAESGLSNYEDLKFTK